MTNEFRVNPNAKIDSNSTYHLKAWVAKPLIPNNAGSYVADIEEIVAAFTSSMPNITIETYFIPELDIETKLAEALQAGEPPDVYINPLSPQVYFGELQVPYGIYVSKEEAAQWIPSAMAQASSKGKIYGYPTAFFSQVFMANTARVNIAGASIEQPASAGWTWEQFFTVIENSTEAGKPGLVITNNGLPLLRAIAASTGKPAPFDDEMRLNWNESDIAAMADIWTKLTSIQGLPALNSVNEDCIGQFLQGKAAIIGPLNPALTRWLWNAAQEEGLGPVLLPIPSASAAAFSDLAACNVVVFRQASYQGHAHTKAAALLAKALGEELGPILSKYLAAIPYEEDHLPFGAPTGQAYSNISMAPRASYAYGPQPDITESHWVELIQPLWKDYVAGKISASDFPTKLHASLSSLGAATP